MILTKFLRRLKNEVMMLRKIIYHRIYISHKLEKNIVDQFHKLYCDAHIFGGAWVNTYWLAFQHKSAH
jgi:hypothetical protein